MRKVLVSMLTVLVVIVSGLLVGMQAISANQGPVSTSPSAASMLAGVTDAQSQVSFHVKVAGWLPFAKSTPHAMVRHPVDGITAVDVEYEFGPREYVRVTTINRPVVEISRRYHLTKISLSNGDQATYLDNGTTQILTWSENTMSYQIVASKASGSYSAAELSEIANAVQ